MKIKNTHYYIGRPRVFGRIKCNICHRVFRAATRFHRFCKTCKQFDELYRFAGGY